jgi:hypothetical protein
MQARRHENDEMPYTKGFMIDIAPRVYKLRLT